MSQIIQDKINLLQANYAGGIFIDPVKSVLTELNSISGGTVYTADNGLTKTLNNIQLGGILTRGTAIDGNNNTFSIQSTNQMFFQSGDNTGINQSTQIITSSTGASIYSQLNGSVYSRLNVNNSSVQLSSINDPNYSRLNLFNNGDFGLISSGTGSIDSFNLTINIQNELRINLPTGTAPGYVLTDVLGDGIMTMQPAGDFVPMVGTATVGPIRGTLEFQAKEYSGGSGNLFGFVAAPSAGINYYLMNGVGYDTNYQINQKGAFTRYSSGTSGAFGSEIAQLATTGLGNQSARQTTKVEYDQEYAATYLEAQTGLNTTRFTVQTSTGIGYAPTLGTTLFDNRPGSRGIRGLQDFTPNIQSLDYVQKKYVDKTHGSTLLEYVDNANALANGLQIGNFYRTGDVLKVVH